jgi:hypothetical protein
MAYTDGTAAQASSKLNHAWHLQLDGIGVPTRFLCVQRAQRVDEAKIDTIELSSRIEVKHKVRSNGSRSSVTNNGDGEH